jgi:hypothetical protein
MTDLEFRLHDKCEALFGNAFSGLPIEVIGPSSEFAEEFEVIKRSFDGGDNDKKHRLRLLPLKRALEATNTTSEKYDFVEGKLILTGYRKSRSQAFCKTDNCVAGRSAICSNPLLKRH